MFLLTSLLKLFAATSVALSFVVLGPNYYSINVFICLLVSAVVCGYSAFRLNFFSACDLRTVCASLGCLLFVFYLSAIHCVFMLQAFNVVRLDLETAAFVVFLYLFLLALSLLSHSIGIVLRRRKEIC